MNKTFKVVFNRARGVLMVANEVTSSVQKKGTRTVVAAVGSMLFATVTQAAVIDTAQKFVGETKTIEDSVVTVENVAGNNGTALFISENANVTISNTQFKNNTHGQNAGGAIWVYGTYGQLKTDATQTYEETKLNLTNVDFIGNSSEWGGAVYIYPDSVTHMKGGSFVGNKAISSTEEAFGGALMFKGGKATFEDVVFTDNVAESDTKAAMGGAILLDITRNNDGKNQFERLTEVTFKVTRDLLYSGNNVISGNQDPSDTYGYWGYTSGGFIFLDRRSKAIFDIADGATLTLGKSDATGHMDSIASAIPQVSDSPKSTMIKQGKGTLLINSSMDYFFSDLFVNEGTMQLTKDQTSKATIVVDGGSLVYDKKLTLQDMVINPEDEKKKYYLVGSLDVKSGQAKINELTLETSTESPNKAQVQVSGGELVVDSLVLKTGDVTISAGSLAVENITRNGGQLTLKNSGVIHANSGVIFNNFGAENTSLNEKVLSTGDLLGGTINLKDFTGEYKLTDLDALNNLTGGSKVTFTNGILNDSDATLDKVIDAGANTAGAEVKADKVTNNGTITIAKGNDATVGSVVVDSETPAKELAISEGKFTLAGDLTGNSKELISGDVTNDFAIKVGGSGNNAELALGFDANSKGQISHTVNIKENSKLTVEAGQFVVNSIKAEGTVSVNNASVLTVDELTGNGTVLVGNEATAGKLVVKSLHGMTGTLFVDPAWQGDAALDVVGNASHLEISDVGTAGLTASVVAGQNSLVSFGATADTAAQAFESIASAQGLSWGRDNITAAVYVDSTLDLGTGGVLVHGGLTTPPTNIDKKLTVNENGMLIVNQANAGDAVIVGDVDLDQGSYLGVINASEGQFNLATGEVVADGASVVTDNPFIDGAINGNTVTTTLNEEAGLGSLASTGIQAMTRHADFIMAETIADRTSIDQELNPGMNLWANVTGERYESTSMDNGGTFKSDMGYGAFGAEVPVTDTVTAGAAIQYGKGSLRSGVASIKNDIDNYGFTAYATKSFGAAKVVGELAYLQSKNDITSSQAAMNQEVDAKIYSAGIRAQYQLTTDHFQFVPSIGIRVSQLETDAMDVGAVKVKEQEQTLVQVPIALRINGFEQSAADGWTLAPSFKVAFVPTFGDEEISVLSHDQDVIDTTPVSADFGLRAKKGNMMVDANFMVGGGKDGTSSVGGKIGMKYVF